MARKTTVTDFIKFSLGDFNQAVYHCASLAKWKPGLAIDWMKELADSISSDAQRVHWNKQAKKINEFLDKVETMYYYNEEEFWESEKPRRLTELEPIISYEELLSLSQK